MLLDIAQALMRTANTLVWQYFPCYFPSRFCPLSKTDFEIKSPSFIQNNAVLPGIKYVQMS